MKLNRIPKYLLTFLFVVNVMSLGALSEAQDITFEASVSAKQVSLGSLLQLTLTVEGLQKSPPIDLPEIDGFESRYLGPSTRVSIVNGQYSSSVAHIYNLFPLKEGKFQIPSITATIQGQAFSTQPIDVEVTDSPVAASSQLGESNQQQVSLEDKVFLVLEASKKSVYLGEKISVTIRLFVTDLSVRDIQLPELDSIGFAFEEYTRPRQYTQTLGGIRYDVVEFNAFIYPTRSGQLTLGPAQLSCSVLYKNPSRRRRSPFDGFDNLFDDDFFGGFFDGVERRPIVLESSNVLIDVLPLPEEGKPGEFSGAVGKFDFSAQVSPSSVNVGDPVTARLKLEGEGNLKAIKMPKFKESKAFKVYEPQIKEENGQKVLEQVLIPKSADTTQIPAIQFSYFDPQSEGYETISRGPFTIEVTKPEGQEDLKVVELSRGQVSSIPETLGRDLIFIKDKPGRFKQRGSFFYKSMTFLVMIVLSFVFFAAVAILTKRKQRIKTDVVYARRLRAPKKAKKGLLSAKHFMEQGRQKEFYDSIFTTLQDYFINKFHLSAGSITAGILDEVLTSKGCKTEVVIRVKDIFNECDMVRYASVTQDSSKMKDVFKKTQEVIDALERL